MKAGVSSYKVSESKLNNKGDVWVHNNTRVLIPSDIELIFVFIRDFDHKSHRKTDIWNS